MKTLPSFFKREGRGSGEPAPARHNTAPCCAQKPSGSGASQDPLRFRSFPRRPRRRKPSALTPKPSAAQRSPAEHCDHPSGAAGQPWARPLLPLPSESLQQRPRVPAPGPMRMRGGAAPGLASSEPARRGAVRSLPFALQACAGGCLLPRLHCPLASPHCDVHVLSPD